MLRDQARRSGKKIVDLAGAVVESLRLLPARRNGSEDPPEPA